MIGIIIGTIGTILGVSLVAEIRGSKDKKKRKEFVETSFQSISDFIPTRKIEGIEGQYIFAVDEDAQQILLVTTKEKIKVPFNKIIGVKFFDDVEEYEDNQSSSLAKDEKDKSSEASSNNQIVSYVKVQIKIDDLNNPNIEINCFDSNSMCDAKYVGVDSQEYWKGVKDAESIVDIVNIIISANTKSVHSSLNSNFVADELEKLAKLREKGLVTDEEYNKQKYKLLNPSSESKTKGEYSNEERSFSDVQDLIDKGKFFLARCLYVELTGCSDKEAKEYVNSHRKH